MLFSTDAKHTSWNLRVRVCKCVLLNVTLLLNIMVNLALSFINEFLYYYYHYHYKYYKFLSTASPLHNNTESIYYDKLTLQMKNMTLKVFRFLKDNKCWKQIKMFLVVVNKPTVRQWISDNHKAWTRYVLNPIGVSHL